MAKMTILEVLKRIKHVDRKIEKSKERLSKWCSYFDIELEPGQEPLYNAEKLMQSINDLIALRGSYRHALHKANIDNKVEYKGKELTIDELLVLRTSTLPARRTCLLLLRRREKGYSELRHLTEDERKAVRVITQFDPLKRDKSVDEIENEMADLDRLLDELNITLTTDIER
jgi:hypothetical protein